MRTFMKVSLVAGAGAFAVGWLGLGAASAADMQGQYEAPPPQAYGPPPAAENYGYPPPRTGYAAPPAVAYGYPPPVPYYGPPVYVALPGPILDRTGAVTGLTTPMAMSLGPRLSALVGLRLKQGAASNHSLYSATCRRQTKNFRSAAPERKQND